MFRTIVRPATLTTLIAAGLSAGSAHAAITGFTNADFEAGVGSQNIPGWFDFQSGNGDLVQSDAPAPVPDDADGNGWLNIVDSPTVAGTGAYQAFGTREATDLAYTFDFNVAERSDADFNDLIISLYYDAGTATPADGTTPLAAGLLLADSTPYDFNIGVDGPATGTASITLSAASVGVGDTVYLAFASVDDQATPGSQQALIDDVTVTAVIPEPASLALVGLGGLCLLGRRRGA